MVATGGYESVGAVPARAFCRVELDGLNTGAAATDNTSSIAHESFTMIGEESGVAKGTHTLRMLCSESGGDVVINSPTIIGLALGT